VITTSEKIGTIAGALAKAQAEMKHASKDAENPHFKSSYADLASIWDACREALTKHGIAVAQPAWSEGNRVVVSTLLMHSSGEWVRGDLGCAVERGGPQVLGSAVTYLRRYGLAAMVGVAPNDDDGEGAEERSSGDRGGPPQGSRPQAPPRGGQDPYVTRGQQPPPFDQHEVRSQRTVPASTPGDDLGEELQRIRIDMSGAKTERELESLVPRITKLPERDRLDVKKQYAIELGRIRSSGRVAS
jgi:hypothetical protein